MFAFFERLVAPFPPEEAQQPPKGIVAFCRHYTKGSEIYLLMMAILTALIAMAEVTLFGFMGELVDWLVTKTPDTLFQDEGGRLLLMSLMVLVVLPVLVLLHGLIVHQTLLGNYPMAIRWMAHRYLLKQSVSFYSSDFAGRIATKVMQTSLAIRETVMKLLDVMMFVLVYFISIIVLVAQADIRLIIPMLIWMACYIGIQMYFVPKLKEVSTEQADARSLMTGRLVDSYTNIQTVKLFSHTDRKNMQKREW
jgi:ATP-binding cassette subfamily B multidrug efflux pump